MLDPDPDGPDADGGWEPHWALARAHPMLHDEAAAIVECGVAGARLCGGLLSVDDERPFFSAETAIDLDELAEAEARRAAASRIAREERENAARLSHTPAINPMSAAIHREFPIEEVLLGHGEHYRQRQEHRVLLADMQARHDANGLRVRMQPERRALHERLVQSYEARKRGQSTRERILAPHKTPGPAPAPAPAGGGSAASQLRVAARSDAWQKQRAMRIDEAGARQRRAEERLCTFHPATSDADADANDVHVGETELYERTSAWAAGRDARVDAARRSAHYAEEAETHRTIGRGARRGRPSSARSSAIPYASWAEDRGGAEPSYMAPTRAALANAVTMPADMHQALAGLAVEDEADAPLPPPTPSAEWSRARGGSSGRYYGGARGGSASGSGRCYGYGGGGAASSDGPPEWAAPRHRT